MDECRKAFEIPDKRELKEKCKAWLETRSKIGFAPHDMAKFVGDVIGDVFAASLAHTEAKVSGEDDALKKELAELQRKAFDEFVTLANGYREALENIVKKDTGKNPHIRCNEMANIARTALATVGKEG